MIQRIFNFSHAVRMASAIAFTAIMSGVPAAAQGADDDLAGLYDGNQTEIAAALELGKDGRYRYQLSYGALDEWSAGIWKRAEGGIVLDSDPFKAPAFAFTESPGKSGALSVRLLVPDGYDPQYFAVNIHRKAGSASFETMSSDGLDIPMGDNPVVSIRPVLPVMDLLGPEFVVPGGGAALAISFQPNDIGFAGFSGEFLRANGGAFELVRYERTLRFKRTMAGN
ncbi:MAG: hypothetical protein KDE32_00410 [Novosphingobium sp.]|nr:hypothetical protein [Novosphingobium sp.]